MAGSANDLPAFCTAKSDSDYVRFRNQNGYKDNVVIQQQSSGHINVIWLNKFYFESEKDGLLIFAA